MNISTPAVILPKSSDFINTMKSFGLEQKWFEQIGLRILAEYNRTTPHDAVVAGGLYAYLSGVRAIRDILTPQGFNFSSQNNIESTYRPTDKFKIIISSGCPETGKDKGTPKTKNPKGAQMKKMLRRDPRQGLIPGIVLNLTPENIWILLFHVDIENEEFRMELSQPLQMEINGEKERVDRWNKRIIFPPIKVNPEPIIPQPEFASDLDIKIKRRGNE